MSSPPSPYFLQPCSATPGAAATMPAGGLTVAFTLTDAGGTVLATRSYQSTGAAATMYRPQTFAGLAPGTYATTAVVSGCAGGSIPVTQGIAIASSASRPGAGFVAIAPVRDVDTRTATRLSPNVIARFRLAHVPAAATGATLNLTAVRPAAGGYLSAFPCDAGAPATSSLNFAPGQTVAAQVTVAVRAEELCLVSSVATDVLVDVNGSFVPSSGSGFATASKRLADTRPSVLAGGGVLDLDLSAFAPLDAEAVSVNVVATQTGADGYLSVFPCGGPPPTVSNLNYAGADTGANLATVVLPPSRHLCVLSSATAAVVVDLTGWWTRSAPGGFVAAAPVRVADTRAGLGGPTLAAGEQRRLLAPAPGIQLLTVTATGQRDAGWLAVFPCGGYHGTSTSNFQPGAARAAAVVIDGATGVCVTASTTVDVLLDTTGTLT
jgi:hypothetical protein